jgi:hypothetical protein
LKGSTLIGNVSVPPAPHHTNRERFAQNTVVTAKRCGSGKLKKANQQFQGRTHEPLARTHSSFGFLHLGFAFNGVRRGR